MKMRTQFELGGVVYNLEIDEREEMDTLHKTAVLSNPPKYCPECKTSQYLQLESNKATTEEGTFNYVYVHCRKCHAKAQLGQYKAGGYFWKKFEIYNPETKESRPAGGEGKQSNEAYG